MGEKSSGWKTVKFDISHQWYEQLKIWRKELQCGTMAELFRYIIRNFLEAREHDAGQKNTSKEA